MNKKYVIGIIGAMVLSMQALFAQVSVNQLTGSANVVIPVYSLTRGAVSVPVNLIYNGSGVKPKDVEDNAGISWHIQAGGQISRQVRGLPDDCKQDTANHTRLGWMYQTTGSSTINGFTIANIGTCPTETADLSYISTNFNYQQDNQPDVFNVSAPGLSCQLVWDNANNKFRTIPYMDVKIDPTYFTLSGDPLDGSIISFKITNDQGVTYCFSSPELARKDAFLEPGHVSPGNYFQNTYLQYQYRVKYYDAWFLTKIVDANGNGITIDYTTSAPRVGADDMLLYRGITGGGTTPEYQYSTRTIVVPQVLQKISTIDKNGVNDYLNFTWKVNPANPGGGSFSNGGTGQSVITSITGSNKDLEFNYSEVSFLKPGPIAYTRYFLRSFTDVGCSTPVNYKFDYIGETEISRDVYTTTLSDSTSINIDYWGYFNHTAGSTLAPWLLVNPLNPSYQRYQIVASLVHGSDYTTSLLGSTFRDADIDYVMTGSLKTITTAQGDINAITYESNDYLDVPSNSNVYGGGARVKNITSLDNVTGKTVTRNYTYINPITSLSSGKPITLPVFGFTVPYTGSTTPAADFWNFATMRSANDLSVEDHTIMYGYVRESVTGAGSTLSQYYIPATNWDPSAKCIGCVTDDWFPTENYMARPTCGVPYGPIKNDIDTYPFVPNPNYDFERGLLQKVTTYNDAGTTVASETSYDYVRSGTPGTITGFAFDTDPDLNNTLIPTAYSKFNIMYGTSELLAGETKKIYDTQGLNQPVQSRVDYTYGPNQHKLATQQTTNSDQSVVTANYFYTKDYNITTHTDPNTNAIYQLQQLNINAPVETYTTIQRGVVAPLVTNASLTLFDSYPSVSGTTMYLPSKQYQLAQANGGASFTPFVAGNPISFDSRYFQVANYDDYDFTGIIQTADDANKHTQAVLIDHYSYHPAISIKNAAASEVVFEDFDSDLIRTWTYTPPIFPSVRLPGGHNGYFHPMGTGQSFSFTLQKNTQATNYIFSVWLFSSGAASISVTLSGGGTVTGTINLTGGTWKYYQLVLPVGALSTTFTATVTCTSGSPGLDDILLYPQNAEVATYYYDEVDHFKLAETNTNGISTYYKLDQWGRVLLQFDQDKNIVQKKTYITQADIKAFVAPFVSYSPGSSIYTSTPVTFSTTGKGTPCYAAYTTYTWDFGDGSPPVTTTTPADVVHTFSVSIAGPTNYTVHLTASSPYFASVTTPVTVTVSPTPPVVIHITYTNSTLVSKISSVDFDNGVTVNTILGTALNGATIPQGSYTITIHPMGSAYDPGTGKGYDSVTFFDGVNSACFNRTGSDFVFPWDLTGATAITFTMLTTVCP